MGPRTLWLGAFKAWRNVEIQFVARCALSRHGILFKVEILSENVICDACVPVRLGSEEAGRSKESPGLKVEEFVQLGLSI